jgi:hypothetical protein
MSTRDFYFTRLINSLINYVGIIVMIIIVNLSLRFGHGLRCASIFGMNFACVKLNSEYPYPKLLSVHLLVPGTFLES